jgi:hypothetical protein
MKQTMLLFWVSTFAPLGWPESRALSQTIVPIGVSVGMVYEW